MSQNLHIVIIEDEAATARNLEYILKEINPEIEIVKILQSIQKQWIGFLNADHYDLIFSDIISLMGYHLKSSGRSI
jgi:two-component SAPR family response regulator